LSKRPDAAWFRLAVDQRRSYDGRLFSFLFLAAQAELAVSTMVSLTVTVLKIVLFEYSFFVVFVHADLLSSVSFQ